ncbi:MAG: GNAT family N-acetyltransferase [Eubacterium sp.]|nr:GNAT family N-acetyltransferase [Eubacterium sp.]
MQIKNDIRTPRLTIRDYKSDDLPYVTAMWFDPENGKYMSDPQKEYVDEVYRKALDGMEDSKDGYYLTVVSNDIGNIMGTCCIFPGDKKDAYDIGYCINKKYWRQGYGTELITALIGRIREYGGTEITAEVAKENAASRNLLLKNGFEILRESEFKKYNMDITFDSFIYKLVL